MQKIFKLMKFKTSSLKYIQGSYSQFGEDFFLRHYFAKKSNGFYVDVGAYHPYKYSNTYYLRSILDWNGINIEPQLKNFELLQKHTNDININCAISSTEGYVNFKLAGVCSSITDEDENASDVLRVRSRRLDQIFIEHNVQHIDFMSIDCEGFDIEALRTNDWEAFRPDLIAVEDHEMAATSTVDEYMKSIGYSMVSWYNLTKFYSSRHKNRSLQNSKAKHLG